jgi:hypothetical protein
MKPLKEIIKKEIVSTLSIDTRWDSARIDGKKTLSDKITKHTISLMKDFHLWVNSNFIQGTHFDINGFYIPKHGGFENYSLDELLVIFFKNKIA